MSAPGEILIRPLTEQDLQQVMMIEQASFPVPWLREHFLHEITAPHSFPFVALVDGAVAGFLCLHALFETAEILDIAVAPEYRGRGIAKLLLEHAEDTARVQGAEHIGLEVRASNHAALTLYEGSAFVRSGVRKRYYEGTEDAVLMDKKL